MFCKMFPFTYAVDYAGVALWGYKLKQKVIAYVAIELTQIVHWQEIQQAILLMIVALTAAQFKGYWF